MLKHTTRKMMKEYNRLYRARVLQGRFDVAAEILLVVQ